MEKETLKTIQDFTGDSELRFIDENDSFDFKCQQCGRCCMNRTDIILNPFDVYNAARYLGITTQEFLKQNAYAILGGTSKIPMFVLTSNEKGYCPLLKFDIKDGGKFKCSIHEAKPGACSNHPIGIVREADIKTKEEKFQFIKVASCPNSQGHNNMNLVKDWCKPYMENYEDIIVAHRLQTLVENYFPCRLLHLVIESILDNKSISNIEEFAKENPLQASIILIYKCFQSKYLEVAYATYDTSKSFKEQAEAKIEELSERLFIPLREVLFAMLKDMPEDLKERVATEIGPSFESFYEEGLKRKNNEEVESNG